MNETNQSSKLDRACSEVSESRREELKKRSLLEVNEHFSTTSNAESETSKQSLGKKKRSTSAKWLIGITVIALAIITIAITQISSNIVYFYTPEEAQTKAAELQQKTIKVGGMVVAGSIQWVAESLDLSFHITDLKGHDISVKHKGTPPDMFKEGQGVVVEGNISTDGKSLNSRKLLVKHSEEYKKAGDHKQSISKEMLEKSMFKE